MKLSPKQTLAITKLEDHTTTELIFGGGAGGGKSVLGSFWVLKCALKYAGTRWVIGRTSLKTLKETTLNTFFDVCAQQGIQQEAHYKYNEVKSRIRFFNGSEVLLKDLGHYPSDPNYDELGSLEITGAFVDECNQVTEKAWLVLKSRIRYRLDENNLIPKILGTCNPAKNWVYMRYYAPTRRGQLPAHAAFIQALVDDNPGISRHYRDNLLTLDKAGKERLLFGNWDYDDDPSALCDFDAISDCFTNHHVQPGNARYISADLAMKGRDRFVAGVWRGLVCDITAGADKLQTDGRGIETTLKELMVKHSIPRSHVVADSDGMGAYLESYLTGIKEFHGGARATDDKEYQNLKSECGYKLAELISKRQLKIICTPQQQQRIAEELSVLKAGNIDGDEQKKHIIRKEQMKELLGRSPDYLDMLLMRMVFETKRHYAIAYV